MMDFIYMLAAIAFFAVMLAYVKGCQVLGARSEREDRAP
jgi:hypothetical protein